MIVGIAIEKVLYSTDKIFLYNSPKNVKAKLGQIVLVPFGKNNKIKRGFILEIYEEEARSNLKSIFEIVDSTVVLTKEQIKMAIWMSKNLFCTYYDAINTIIPQVLNGKMENGFKLNLEKISPLCLLKPELISLYKRFGNLIPQEALSSVIFRRDIIKLCKDEILQPRTWFKWNTEEKKIVYKLDLKVISNISNIDLTPKQKKTLNNIKPDKYYTKKELIETCEASDFIINALIIKGILKSELKITKNDNHIEERKFIERENSKFEESSITSVQQKILNDLIKNIEKKKFEISLIWDTANHNRLKLFLKLVEKIIKEDGTVLILIPDIVLIPSIVNKFISKFGNIVAVLHCELKMREKISEWNRIKNKTAKIIIGTRSAVFAPFSKLNLIIVDEEESSSYLSFRRPFYSAVELAKFLAFNNNCCLILVSTTPSIAAFNKAKSDKYNLFLLNENFSKNSFPKVEIVDMNLENAAEKAIISKRLIEELKINLARGEQSILLIGKKGYSTFIKCLGCGNVITCPNCGINLVYHITKNILICHCCGYKNNILNLCQFCGSEFIEYNGIGIEKVEAQLKKLGFTRILRIDSDTISSNKNFRLNIKDFLENKYDIIIGTQIIARGFYFPNVTLIGMIEIDQIAFCNDYKCHERAFSLLTQVISYANHSRKAGRAIIQTNYPTQELFSYIQQNNYEAFFEQEIATRYCLNLPPICDLLIIGFVGRDIERVLNSANQLFKVLKEELKIDCIPPMPAKQSKVGNNYRFKILIYHKNNFEFRNLIRDKLKIHYKFFLSSNVKVFIDPYMASNF